MTMILNVRDKDGNFIPIPAIRGEAGKSAYEQAKDGGYKGTLEEFIALLNGLTNTEDAAHYSDFNNPHRVTANQTGALAKAYEVSYDLNVEIQRGGNSVYIHNYCEDSLNTPYKEGKTNCTHGMVITNAYNANYGTQMCMPSGESAIYTRTLNGQGITNWVKTAYNNSLSGGAIGDGSIAMTGGAIGVGAMEYAGGGAIGAGAVSNEGGGAVGISSLVMSGGAVGSGAKATNGGAVGKNAETTSGGAVGNFALAQNGGGAIGSGASSNKGFSGGLNAMSSVDCIQLGEGENENERTLQVYDYQLLGSNGIVPSERLPIASGTYTGTGKCGEKYPNTLTFDFVPKILIVSKKGSANATGGGTFIWINPNSTLTFINNGSSYWPKVSIEGTVISWYNADSSGYQLNSSNDLYNYFAIG